MFSNYNPLVLLSGTSIILAVTIWPILCYNFVLNCMQLMITAISLTKGYSDELQDENQDMTEGALAFTMYSGIIISEGILVVCLVIQFMSSFDYLTGSGEAYEENWVRCHRKVLLINSIVLTTKLFTSFLVLNFQSTLNDSILELYAMAVNFIFLVIAVNMAAVALVGRRSSDQEQQRQAASPADNHQIIHVHSFLSDRPPAYSDLEKIPIVPEEELPVPVAVVPRVEST